MMELEVAGQRTPIPIGDLVIGADPSSGLRLSGIAAAHVIVSAQADGSCSARRVGDNDVLLNGVKLGAEPAPILHGDKLQVGLHELLVTDPRRSGSTQFVSAADVAKMVSVSGGARPGTAKPATAATGGRMVCLTDGREYTIGTAPMVIGREAGCDIVVPNKDVSRRHAEIFASPQGYVLVDSSTNGTFVNGDRIEAQRVLARADVIRIGDHEFRFYADRAAEAAPPPPPVAAPVAPPPPVPTPVPVVAAAAPPAPSGPPTPAPTPMPPGAAERLSSTMLGMPLTPTGPKPAVPVATAAPPQAPAEPAVPRPSASTGPIATFLIRSGSLKGQRLTVRVPVVNIGRAEYNDLVIAEDSVSGSHAKLQRREGVWVLTDNDSTNGTWVDGERVQGEVMLGPGSVVRFGEISVLFEPTDDHLGTGHGSGTKVMGAIRTAAPPPSPPPSPPASPSQIPAPAPPPPRPAAAEPFREPPPRPAPEPPRTPPPERMASSPAPRRPVVVSSPPTTGMPRWVVPLIVVIILGVAVILLMRN